MGWGKGAKQPCHNCTLHAKELWKAFSSQAFLALCHLPTSSKSSGHTQRWQFSGSKSSCVLSSWRLITVSRGILVLKPGRSQENWKRIVGTKKPSGRLFLRWLSATSNTLSIGHSSPKPCSLICYILPETDSSHPKRKLIFQPSIFRCYKSVSFRECTETEYLWISSSRSC